MRLMSRSFFTAVATVGLALATAGSASALPILIHDYHLGGAFGYVDSEGGADLTPNGGSNAGFGYTYGFGEGLTATTMLAGPALGNYTLELDFFLDGNENQEADGGWQKIVDFGTGATGDTGVYWCGYACASGDGQFQVYGEDFGGWGEGSFTPATAPLRLWLTRDTTGFVQGRVGAIGDAFYDTAVDFGFMDTLGDFVFASNIINFFMDEAGGTDDNGSGFVDNIRIYAGSFNDPVPAPIPEPATLLLFGSGMAFVARRVRRRQAAE